MNNFKDLTGQRFGRWTVIKKSDIQDKRYIKWTCRCDCGTERDVNGTSLKSGKSLSCGCLQKEVVRKQGLSNTKENIFDLSNEYGVGYTTKGEPFYFDLDDYDKIKNYCWIYNNQKYVYTRIKRTNQKVFMHRIVVDVPHKAEIDHINHLPYDNRKSNLRIVTRSQNNMNHGLNCRNTSGVTGISFNKPLNKWVAEIHVNNKKIHIGVFTDIEDAKKARKEAEEKYFGEFSYDNSIKGCDTYDSSV